MFKILNIRNFSIIKLKNFINKNRFEEGGLLLYESKKNKEFRIICFLITCSIIFKTYFIYY